MKNFDTKKYPIYASFLNQLAKDLTKFYYSKLDKPFKITNKMKGKGYDPVTTSDKAFEKFIRSKISKKFPNHQIIGEEYGHKNSKSKFPLSISVLFIYFTHPSKTRRSSHISNS